MFLGREPVLWAEFVRAVLLVLMGFGAIDVSQEQFGLLMLAVGTVLALITRSQVTPNINVRSRVKGA